MGNKTTPIIGIVGGNSPFGQWFKTFFENCGYVCLIADKKTTLTPRDLAQKADIVIISVPIRETLTVIKDIRDSVKEESLLCDFTSLKTKSLKEMLKRKGGGVLGIHPLFGPLTPSMKNQNIVFCPGRNNKWVKILKELFENRGAKVTILTAKEHDRQMAIVQALPHFTNIVFSKVLQKQKISKSISTPVFELQNAIVKKILNGKASLYADISIDNQYSPRILKQFIKEASSLSRYILAKKKKEFEKEFKNIAKSINKSR